ncbi:MAG: sigma-54-dependent Fis family transcriptional regulator [Verrucomicrobia bacterium]|nr:sigma-54-dependent Fis family transcriptional regulator [Verrucomicrobiota bacterium]
MPHKADILLVDDEEALCVAAEKILLKEGYRVTCVHTAAEGLDRFQRDGADLIITDLALPDQDGLTVLRRAKQLRATVEVIVITGHGTVEKAVEAMRLGAYDFIEKPLDRGALLKAVAKAVEKQRLTAENLRLRDALEQIRGEEALIGNSAPMLAVKKLIRQIAPTDVSVLIQGESGTGKEIVADAIHLLSSRRDKPIIKISCAAIPETLLESELFGYERGAFTGAANTKPGKLEVADGGTLFLDEIAEMSTPLQAKLLRVLQDGRFQRLGSTRDTQIDVRIISASNVDIPHAIAGKMFREDLYYRLNVVHISLPPLRERTDDIPLLANHFLQKYAARMRKDVRAIAPAALDQLFAHPWPGNVRELENAIQRAIAVTTDATISSFILCAPLPGLHGNGSSITVPVGTTLEKTEERLIAETLALCDGDKEKAAKMLGVSSRTLYRRSAKS